MANVDFVSEICLKHPRFILQKSFLCIQTLLLNIRSTQCQTAGRVQLPKYCLITESISNTFMLYVCILDICQLKPVIQRAVFSRVCHQESKHFKLQILKSLSIMNTSYFFRKYKICEQITNF